MFRWKRAGPLLALLAMAFLLLAVHADDAGPSATPPRDLRDHNVHTVFLTDCQMYSDWQSVGMIFSFRASGQPGPLTRVMCCSPSETQKYPKEMLDLVPTHIAPSMTVHPRTGAFAKAAQSRRVSFLQATLHHVIHSVIRIPG